MSDNYWAPTPRKEKKPSWLDVSPIRQSFFGSRESSPPGEYSFLDNSASASPPERPWWMNGASDQQGEVASGMGQERESDPHGENQSPLTDLSPPSGRDSSTTSGPYSPPSDDLFTFGQNQGSNSQGQQPYLMMNVLAQPFWNPETQQFVWIGNSGGFYPQVPNIQGPYTGGPYLQGPPFFWNDNESQQRVSVDNESQQRILLNNNHARTAPAQPAVWTSVFPAATSQNQQQHPGHVSEAEIQRSLGRVYKFQDPEEWDDEALYAVNLAENYRGHMVVPIKPALRSCGCWVMVAVIASTLPEPMLAEDVAYIASRLPIAPSFPTNLFPDAAAHLQLCIESENDSSVLTPTAVFTNSFVNVATMAAVPLRILRPVHVSHGNELGLLRFTDASLLVMQRTLDGGVLPCAYCGGSPSS